MRELIGSVMVSSPLLLAFGTLSLLLYFQLPSTFLPSKGRSITTLGTRCHDFFLLLFLDILQNCFIRCIILLFLFSRDADSRKAHCARSVFPFVNEALFCLDRGTYISTLFGVCPTFQSRTMAIIIFFLF